MLDSANNISAYKLRANDDDLYAKFEPYGEMFQSKVVYDKNTNRSKGGYSILVYA